MKNKININRYRLINFLKNCNFHIKKTAEHFNCSRTVISRLIKEYKIKYNRKQTHRKNLSIAGKLRKDNNFRKGLAPWNKDKIGVYSDEALFKMGNRWRGKSRPKKLLNIKNFNSVGVQVKHRKIERRYGKANCCDIDNNHSSKRYEWANVRHNYKNNIKSWIRLCTSCHRLFDNDKINISIIKKSIKKRILCVY